MKRLLLLPLLLLLFGTTLTSHGQDRCGVEEYKKLQKHPESIQRFEQWIDALKPVSIRQTRGGARTQATYQVPVVVHVIHNGVNDPTNISDAQVLSQIKVLNADFNRTNADASSTPSEFASLAGSINIEFVLAKRTPEGLPTNGIVRVQGSRTSWTLANNYELKSQSYWPSDQYLNIWVCNLTDYLGYAQFPETSLLDGLDNSSPNPETDGVVITHTAFGSIDDGAFTLQTRYNKGRTTTHEVGHFFGLRHIWGDDGGSCENAGDYVSDTPDQGDRTTNCPSHPRQSCNNTSMFQNYLDYTNDACMNLFTQGQVERMEIILNNSPRRKSLLTSPALNDPVPVADDLGIRNIVSPRDGECSTAITPVIELRNYGNNDVTTATVRLKRNGNIIETRTFPLALAPLESAQVSFSSITLSAGTSAFSFEIQSTNGVADGYAFNNVLSKDVVVSQSVATPFSVDLNSLPAGWLIQNPDRLTTWKIANAPAQLSTNNALMMNFYEYEDNEGEIDVFLSPVFDLTEIDNALLLLDVAHATYQGSNDVLRIIALTDCNVDLASGTVVYEKGGSTLATAEETNESFEPSSSADWRTESISLASLSGKSGVQLAFIGVNDYGNNLYIDNIRLLTGEYFNISLKEITMPSAVECNTNTRPRIVVTNSGSDITSFEVQYVVNGVTNLATFSGLTFESGTEMSFELPQTLLNTGTNELQFTVQNPNGVPDADPNDNEKAIGSFVARNKTAIPFRQNFEADFEESWISTSPSGNATWERITLAGNQSLVYRAFSNPVSGDQAWLVSPVIDLSSETEASLTFDLSYAQRNTIADQLDIMISRDCDSPFEVFESYTGTELSLEASSSEWEPSLEDDWKNYELDISGFTGESAVRVAFVVTNKKGNNLYVDNVQLFLSATAPGPIDGPYQLYPNPVFGPNASIQFNLPEQADIRVEIVDSMGRLVSDQSYESILNQVINLDVPFESAGVYLVRIITPSTVYSTKMVRGSK